MMLLLLVTSALALVMAPSTPLLNTGVVCDGRHVLEYAHLLGFREVMNFDINRKYYDEKKKKAYRAKLKERKEAEEQKK